MANLDIQVAIFSPAIGGIENYAVIKYDKGYKVFEAHKDPKYHCYIGEFKKPGIGMLMVLKDILKNEFNQSITQAEEIVFIGGKRHDKVAAHAVGIPFLNANKVLELEDINEFANLLTLNKSITNKLFYS